MNVIKEQFTTLTFNTFFCPFPTNIMNSIIRRIDNYGN